MALWHAAGLVLVVSLPTQWRLQRAFWLLSSRELIQVLVWGIAFLGLALLVAVVSSAWRRATSVALVVAAGLLCWLAGYLFLSVIPDIPVSRAMALATLVLSLGLTALPAFRPSRLTAAAPLLGLISLGFILFAAVTTEEAPPESTALRTALHPIEFTVLRDVVQTGGTDGGAVAALGEGFLHVNGAGEFSRLDWDSSGSTLVARPVLLSPPLDRPGFLADQTPETAGHSFRVTDLLIHLQNGVHQVLVAHSTWDSARRCLTLSVSRTTLRLDQHSSAEAPPWERLFETTPCHPVGKTVRLNQTGGQMAWLGKDSLLLTVGDQGFEGQSAPIFAQDTAADYGKVILISPRGGSERWTMGHRNPQGLVVDRDGRAWVSEQGPQGGDEINLLREGGNYGWPLATYGTNYGTVIWPLNRHPRHHGEFIEPAHAFVPSPAITSIIQVGGNLFTAWRGDLLIGSLKARSLIRVRTRDDRVTYAEPIVVGERIRDLAEGADGRIILWTESGALVILGLADPEKDGRLVYGVCGDCHGTDLRGTERGPPLVGVVERRIAGWPGYPFSAALRQRTGEWTLERLDEFLLDPQAFAPGTTMELAPMTNAAERRALIEFLRRQ